MQSAFINELGHAIAVKTTRIRSDCEYDEIEMKIEEPASHSSWIVTYDEATVMWRQLGELLRSESTRVVRYSQVTCLIFSF